MHTGACAQASCLSGRAGCGCSAGHYGFSVYVEATLPLLERLRKATSIAAKELARCAARGISTSTGCRLKDRGRMLGAERRKKGVAVCSSRAIEELGDGGLRQPAVAVPLQLQLL